MNNYQYIPQAEQRLAVARNECACPYVYGISFPCPATLLAPIGQTMVIRGDVCDVPMLPVRFQCPRYAIMGW